MNTGRGTERDASKAETKNEESIEWKIEIIFSELQNLHNSRKITTR
jgi:hypothetical protein